MVVMNPERGTNPQSLGNNVYLSVGRLRLPQIKAYSILSSNVLPATRGPLFPISSLREYSGRVSWALAMCPRKHLAFECYTAR